MKINELKSSVLQFVHAYANARQPILVAVSGGVDSIALLYLLLEIPNLQLGVAHVDHGYRKESKSESRRLKELADALGLPFHLKQLDPTQLEGNLEDAWRVERYAFFKEICDSHGYQGVAMGHHADDQVETIFKRILEGAHLTSFRGILPSAFIYGVNVLRPLIGIEKSTLTEYVATIDFTPFNDSSNSDTKFLRARMRLEMLPALNSLFGKNIKNSLMRLARESAELNDYLDERTASHMASIVRGPFGLLLDLSSSALPARFELMHLVQRFCNKKLITLSRTQLEIVCDLIENQESNKKIESCGLTLHVDRRRLFLLETSPSLPAHPCSLELSPGRHSISGWTVEVESFKDKPIPTVHSGWLDVWKGALLVVLPKASYTMDFASPKQRHFQSSEIGKWWSDHKIPAFMRPIVPAIFHQQIVVHEFLTPANVKNHNSLNEGLIIRMIFFVN